MLPDDDNPKSEPSEELDTPVYAEDKPKRGIQSGMPPAGKKVKPLTCGCIALIVAVSVFCCAIPAAVFGAGVAASVVKDRNTVREERTEYLEVSREGQVNLVVENVVGETRIRGDEVDQIEVEIELKSSAFTKERAQEALDNIEVNVRREGTRYLVTVIDHNGDDHFLGDRSVELLITVPRELNITATNDVGALSVKDVEIINELQLTNSVGEIVFEGKIEAEGIYRITNDVGSVQVKLDSGSRLRLDARADVGGIDSRVELAQERDRRDVTSQHLTGIFGDDENPEATLTIITNVGGIEIDA
jgi:hypothetical protein